MEQTQTVTEELEIRQQKAKLRCMMDQCLNSLSEEEILRQSAAVTDKVLGRPEFQRARSVAVYLSLAREVQTDALVAHILGSGRTCYVPRFRAGAAEMEMVQVWSAEDVAALPANRWGIRQPPLDEARPSVFDAGELDVVLAPGAAFCADGRRLGHGKGYYDRFLWRCARELRTPPAALALAFREQMLPDLPTTPRDFRLHAVLTAD